MKASIEAIQRCGYSEAILQVAKKWKNQKMCNELTGNSVERSTLSLFKHDGCFYHEGVIKKSASVIVELSRERVIEVNTAYHKLLRVDGEEVKDVTSNQVLDLSDEGERWEGDVLDNKPYGWGVLYDKEGEKVYEGFRIGKVNVCYGTQYYPDIQKVEYEGEWFEGKRWGRGIQYDRTGIIVFDGEWVNDEPLSKRVVLNRENQLLHNHIEELIVQDNSCNGREWSVLDLSFMPCLRLLQVGDNCFVHVDEVKLIGLNQLESVVIGKECFIGSRNDQLDHFYLKNCPQLRELKMGCYSFSGYSVCEIENVPSLEVVEIGELNEVSWNFDDASLELKSDSQRMRMMNRFTQFEITSVWRLCIPSLFSCCP